MPHLTIADPEVRAKIFQTDYPLVFVTGFFGFSDVDLAVSLINYWTTPSQTSYNPVPTFLRQIFIRTEKLGSPHHGSTEVFFQLMGGVIDYGQEHADDRYGRGYAPQHPLWSRKKQDLDPCTLGRRSVLI